MSCRIGNGTCFPSSVKQQILCGFGTFIMLISPCAVAISNCRDVYKQQSEIMLKISNTIHLPLDYQERRVSS